MSDPHGRTVLERILNAAGLPTSGRYASEGGWVSRAWVGDEHVVRVAPLDAGGASAYEHEAKVVGMLAGTAVPHAAHIAHGVGPDGAWYISSRLPGRTLHDAWPSASLSERRSIIESLGQVLEALHAVTPPTDLMPPWLAAALSGGPWPAYHPPVIAALPDLAASADLERSLSRAVQEWVAARMQLFADDPLVLVHGDLHGSNIMVDEGRVAGLIDFAEAIAAPADAELDTILRWCARPAEFPPRPGARGLTASSLASVPDWLQEAYPALFARSRLRVRLDAYDLWVELAIVGHHPDPTVREASARRIERRVVLSQ